MSSHSFFCTSCGTHLSLDATFCTSCGSKTKRADSHSSEQEEDVSRGLGDDFFDSRVRDVQSNLTSGIRKNKGSLNHRSRLAIAVGGALVLVGVAVFALTTLVGGKDDSSTAETTASLPAESSVLESAPTSTEPQIAAGLAVNSFLTNCDDSIIAADLQNRVLVLRSATSATMQEQWSLSGLYLASFSCGGEVAVASFAMNPEGLSLIDSRQWTNGEVTKFDVGTIRIGIKGECCFPTVPYVDAYVLQVQENGTFVVVEDEYSRFDRWNPVTNYCDSFTRPDRYPAVYSDGRGQNLAPEPLYITICSRGQYVTELQNILIDLGYNIYADGLFGPATFNALRSSAEERGHDADGIFASDWSYAKGGRDPDL